MTEDKYLSTKNIQLDYLPEPETVSGIQTFENPNDSYLYCTYDLLLNSELISRKGRLYMSRKPYAFTVKNTEYALITMPGSCYHDRPAWLMWELMDFFLGEEIVGGYSVVWDKHRRTVYAKGNGESDWAYKKALGAMNENQVWWAQRSLRMDPGSRNCIISPWHSERDLKHYVMNKENDDQRGDTYQRLPCITSIQFTKEDKEKSLSCFQYQRSLDYTGAVHCDLWRFAEVTDWLARTSYPSGFGGPMSVFVGTTAIESYGAAAFVKFNKALEWWCSNDSKTLRNLPSLWPSHKDGYSYTEPNKPRQKMYDWYLEQFNKTADAARACYYARFDEAQELIRSGIEYLYYNDWAKCFLLTGALRVLWARDQYQTSLFDNKKVNAALEFASQPGQLFKILGSISNYYQYHMAVEVANYFIAKGMHDELEELWECLPSNENVALGVMVDAMLYTNKTERKKLAQGSTAWYGEVVNFYDEIFG